MSTKASIHTFKKGMVKDLDRSLVSPDSYLDALNFRVVTGVGESTGALENIEGNNHIGTLLPEDYYIVGTCMVRNRIILFITDGTNSRILSAYFSKSSEDVFLVSTLYDDDHNGGTGRLNFSVSYPIKAIGRYETPNIQKVYWTDGLNNLRYMNVASNLTVTGEAYPTSDYFAPEMFEFLPPFVPTKPVLVDMVGGTLTSGMVQYSYQLYKLNGAETAFSPTSDLIHLVSDSDFKVNTLTYKGDSESKNTGKGCKLNIVNNNTGYNRLRLIRVYYPSLNAIPTITVCNEIEIVPSAGTIEVTDIGNTVDTLTLDQFNLYSTELFSCQDIATKDNRLFASNIKKSEFTVDDWDARAIRFKGDQTSSLLDSGQGESNPLYDFSDWVAEYPIDHDGINPFNDTDNDGGGYDYKYQADGATLGAEGKNIKIDFSTSSILLDTSVSYKTFYSPAIGVGSDLSYGSYASPWKGGKLSWQRDEVYRLFVIFGNDRGQVSDPKWICDLRMPSLHDDSFVNSSGTTHYPSKLVEDTVFGRQTSKLFPRVYFKNFPANATWAQITRVKRERADKSVVTQGVAIPHQYDADLIYRIAPSYDALPTTANRNLIKLVSPEININKNISFLANDYIEYATVFDTSGVGHFTDYYPYYQDFYKCLENTKVSYAANNRSDINEAFLVSPGTDHDDTITINNKQFNNYSWNTGTLSGSHGCSGLLIDYENSDWTAEGNSHVVVNYRSKVFGSQYGGNTFEDRNNNISIPCSDVITLSDVDANWINVSYGDVYISYFDFSSEFYDLSNQAVNLCRTRAIYVPLESSINCDLRYDSSSAHVSTLVETAAFRQETAGTHEIGGNTYIQDEDLYSYNSVYSQESSVKNSISLPIDTPIETDFDCLVKSSGLKYNGEISDSWTKFAINEEIEVDSSFGAIIALENFRDRLMFFQEHGFGILSVNERSLINQGSTSQLVLGTGGLLSRYDYISTSVGIDDKFTIVQSQTGLYWLDPLDRSLYRFTDSLSNLSKNKMMQSWFNSNYYNPLIVRGIYDNKYNEVIYSFYNGVDGYTLAFNEATDAFTSFYSFVTGRYFPYSEGGYFSTNILEGFENIYYHNSSNVGKCDFYGTVYPSTIKLIVNQDYVEPKVFDNVFFSTTSYDQFDLEQQQDTFTSVTYYNNTQTTDVVPLVYKTNLERREKEWTAAVPRNALMDTYPDNNDLTGGTINTAALYRDRMRDKYLMVDLVYDNSTGYRFICPYFGIKYRLSNR